MFVRSAGFNLLQGDKSGGQIWNDFVRTKQIHFLPDGVNPLVQICQAGQEPKVELGQVRQLVQDSRKERRIIGGVDRLLDELEPRLTRPRVLCAALGLRSMQAPALRSDLAVGTP